MNLWRIFFLYLFRINSHEAKENIHLRSTSISRTLFRFFSFSGTSVSLSKSRDTGRSWPPIHHFTTACAPLIHHFTTACSPCHAPSGTMSITATVHFSFFWTGHVSIFHNFLKPLVGFFLPGFAALASLGGPQCILGCSGEGCQSDTMVLVTVRDSDPLVEMKCCEIDPSTLQQQWKCLVKNLKSWILCRNITPSLHQCG